MRKEIITNQQCFKDAGIYLLRSLQARISQFLQDWHFGPDNSLLWEAALWTVGCFFQQNPCHLPTRRGTSTLPHNCDKQKHLQPLRHWEPCVRWLTWYIYIQMLLVPIPISNILQTPGASMLTGAKQVKVSGAQTSFASDQSTSTWVERLQWDWNRESSHRKRREGNV